MEKIEEIQSCERRLLQAVQENDIESLEILLHPDLLFVNPMGKIITKELDMANYRSGQIIIERLQASEQTVKLIDNTAIVTVKVNIKGKYLEHLLDESFRFLRIWKQEELIWRVIGGSSIKI